MRKGFTLVELIIVIIIVGIMAPVALTQYNKVVEKSRGAEARMILGNLRSSEIANNYDAGAYISVTSLGIGAPDSTCATTHYFSYACTTAGTCTATRCTAGGRTPNGGSGWTKTLDITGTWTGTAGY